MVEVSRHCQALRENIRGCEINAYGVAAACRLCIVAFYAAYERLVVLECALCIEGQVVAYAGARAFHFQYGIEAYNFVSGADTDCTLGGLDELPGRGVERESTLVAVFGIELEVVLKSGIDAEERREPFGDGYRRYVVWR